MKYTVSINYYNFDFDDLKDATTFCLLARRGNLDAIVTLSFNFEESEGGDNA